MKYGLLAIALFCLLLTADAQSGRVQRKKGAEKPPSAAELPLNLSASRPVLVNMKPDEFQACGLNKLSDEELDHLDHWFLDLLVKLQSLPRGRTLKFEKLETNRVSRQEMERQRQQCEARLSDLRTRLAMVSREARRMSFDVTRARMAASRGDWGAVDSSLMGLESSLRRIQQASQ